LNNLKQNAWKNLMTDEKIMATIQLFTNDDPEVQQRARDEIRAMGKEAIAYLNRAKGNVFQYSYVDVFHMLADIGDDQFATGGAEAISKSIVSSMEHGAKVQKDSIFSPIAIKEIGIKALTRWGLPIPQPRTEPVLHCCVCDQSSQETKIKRCFLLNCENMVCEEHAAIMKSGVSVNWFCSQEHYDYANHHPEIMM